MSAYDARFPLSGDGAAALAAARAVLASHGFHVDVTERTLDAFGPVMNSSKENPLRGAGRLRMTAENGELHLTSDLAGTHLLAGVVTVMPLLTGLGFAVTFGWPGLAPATPWVVLGPAMTWRLRRRTRAALDALATDVAKV